MNLHISPCNLDEAHAFVDAVHRHHRRTWGGKFAIACATDECVHGVVVVGRPVARLLDDGYTLEVTRLATDGTKNACSMLYAAAWRATRAMGYHKLITYILDTEPGTSLRAVGWKLIGKAGGWGGTWNRPNSGRPRVDTHPLQGKLRWEISE
jgi:hypothetical protein